MGGTRRLRTSPEPRTHVLPAEPGPASRQPSVLQPRPAAARRKPGVEVAGGGVLGGSSGGRSRGHRVWVGVSRQQKVPCLSKSCPREEREGRAGHDGGAHPSPPSAAGTPAPHRRREGLVRAGQPGARGQTALSLTHRPASCGGADALRCGEHPLTPCGLRAVALGPKRHRSPHSSVSDKCPRIIPPLGDL